MISAILEDWVTYNEDKRVDAIHFMKVLRKECHGWFLEGFALALMAV